MSTLGPIVGFRVDDLYSINEIQAALSVGNAGGVRVCLDANGEVVRAVILTSHSSARQLKENPYHDRVEGDVLVYTGAGREGDQLLTGVNKRIPQQPLTNFPLYGFLLVGSRRDPQLGSKRWRFLGLLEYLRHYPEQQVDVRGSFRRAWMFELRIHPNTPMIDPDLDKPIWDEIRKTSSPLLDDREIANVTAPPPSGSNQHDPIEIERTRAALLAIAPQAFEHVVSHLLSHSGFERTTVTKFSGDGGIDVVAYAGKAMWPIHNLLVQVQAKRWLHTVGRKEVAGLRGSLGAYARGVLVTTSHFTRAAVLEASDSGKSPIVLVNGHELATIVLTLKMSLP